MLPVLVVIVPVTPGAPPDVPPSAGVVAVNPVVVLPNPNVKAPAVGKAVIGGMVACVVPNPDPDQNVNFSGGVSSACVPTLNVDFAGGVGGTCVPNPNVNFTGVVGSVFFFFSVDASFFNVCTGTNKTDIYHSFRFQNIHIDSYL